jgi:hypothetical protein
LSGEEYKLWSCLLYNIFCLPVSFPLSDILFRMLFSSTINHKCKNFQEIWELPQNYRCRKGNMKQVLYLRPII